MALFDAVCRNTSQGNFRCFLSFSLLRRAIPILLTMLLAAGLAACDSTATRPMPPPPTPAGPAVDVDAGWWKSCSVRTDGRIVCWGLNANGSDAQGPLDADFQSVSVGYEHACAIRNNGDLACWSDYNSRIDPYKGSFVSVETGRFHSCALRDNGTVECWLTDEAAHYPNHIVGQAAPPAESSPFQSVSAGSDHTCAVTHDGAALCWGDNEFGQSSPPESQFRSVSAGLRHTCGIQTDGSVTCWGGKNGYGTSVELKKDGGDDQSAVQASPPAGTFQALSSGADYTCGIRADGSIACWGLLYPSWYGAPPITKVQMTPPEGVFGSVSVGYHHACAVRKDSFVICWGDNSYGHTHPPGYASMSSNGAEYLCEEVPGGSSVCRAKNGAPDPSTPTEIPAPAHYTAIIAGVLHTCGLTDHAAIACWGDAATPPAGASGPSPTVAP